MSNTHERDLEPRDDRLEVDVVVRTGAFEQELSMSIPAAGTVADLAAAAAPAHARIDALRIDGVTVDAATAVAATGIRHGSVLTIGGTDGVDAVDGPRSPVTTVLAVIGGPDAGRTLELSVPSTVVVGSGPDVDLRIDDATVSPRHVCIETTAPGVVRCVDLGSHNGVRIDGAPVHGAASARWGQVVAIGATDLVVRTEPDERPSALAFGASPTMPFNRPPRHRVPDPVAELAVPDPPATRHGAARFDVAALIAPIVIAGVMVFVLGSIRYVAFALMGPVVLVISHLTQRRRHTTESRSTARGFAAALEAFAVALADAGHVERARLDTVVPDPAVLVTRAITGSVRLWERRPGHADDLVLRIGRGDRPWRPPVDPDRVAGHESLDAAVTAASIVARCAVESDLGVERVVGVVGDRAMALALARSFVLQAAILHGPADLRVEVHATPGSGADWTWTGWLPHVRGAQRTGPSVFVRSTDDVGTDAGAQAVEASRELLVIDGPDLADGRGAALRRRLAATSTVAVVIAASADRLPSSCATVVTVDDLGDASVTRPAAARSISPVVIAGISLRTATTAARALARHRDPECRDGARLLPSQVLLTSLLGADAIDASAVSARWQRPGDLLEVPIGATAEGVVRIDLVADGPHMLVGGTTGSGKSELLRSLVAGLAATRDPDHVVFVLVDYKGGSAFDACAALPHVVGLVTDLDGGLARRALRSLEAELRVREERLRAAGSEDLIAYRAAGSPGGPLPRLVVVVDEFAAMAVEVPDFLGSLVGIARRGRSLGVHLVLATQRPSGVVDAEIRANTNLRVALRMQDPGDSQDVIDRRDAATIDRATPGRAMLRVGPGEITMIQTALATAPARSPGREGATARPRPLYADAIDTPDAEQGVGGAASTTALAEIVDRCVEAQRRRGVAAPRRPWIEPLPALVELAAIGDPVADADADAAADELDGAPGSDAGVVIALLDDPDRQCRRALRWFPADGHLGIVGALGSGTTTAVVTTALAAMSATSPTELWVYGFDHGGGSLASLAPLPHVGAIVGADDIERRSRLVGFLADELARRRGGETARPRILVVIDQLPSLLAELDTDAALAATMRRVLIEGAAFGIAAAVSADRAAAVAGPVLSSLTRRLQLRPADPLEVATLGLRPRDLPAFVPGRAIDVACGLEAQIAVADTDAHDRIARRWRAVTTTRPAITVMPDVVPIGSLPPATRRSDRVHLPIGPGDPDLAVRSVALGSSDHLFVAGPAGAGVSTSLRAALRHLRVADPAGVMVLIAEQGSPVRCETRLVDAVGTMAQLRDVLEFAERDQDRRWTLVVDGADAIVEAPGLERLARSGHCRLVVGGRSDRLHGVFGHWTRSVRAGGVGLLLQPRLDIDGELLGVRLPRTVATPLRPGRGFLVDRGSAALVQVGCPEPDPDPADGSTLPTPE